MSSRLDTCLEALRLLARSSELEATRLMTAELRVREFLAPAGSNRAVQRAALEELASAIDREAPFKPEGRASFWQGVMDFVDQQLVQLED